MNLTTVWDSIQESIKEMYKQVKNASWKDGLLTKGLAVRHLGRRALGRAIEISQ